MLNYKENLGLTMAYGIGRNIVLLVWEINIEQIFSETGISSAIQYK